MLDTVINFYWYRFCQTLVKQTALETQKPRFQNPLWEVKNAVFGACTAIFTKSGGLFGNRNLMLTELSFGF